MADQPELFSVDEVGERKPLPKGGYPARPGSGPEGETCKTCRHYCVVPYHGKAYRKCALVEWTHGPGTDIKSSSPACLHWESSEDR